LAWSEFQRAFGGGAMGKSGAREAGRIWTLPETGGAIGLAIYGAIFTAQLTGNIDMELVQAPRAIKNLPSPMREETLSVFAHAVTTVFRMAIPVLIITLVLSCLIPGRQLKGRAEATSP
jgi:hypothetical protein